ncbi:MAG TPA: S41 family peptidase [Polyangiaceae bacterium]|nr:S41 family peptidase [Polyangiaceae bacterium]
MSAFALSLFAHWQPVPGECARLGLGRTASATPQPKPGSELKRQHVVDATLQQIRDKYFEPARVDPRRMFLAALTHMQDEMPASLVSYDGHSARVILRVGVEERAFRVDDIQGPWDVSARLREVFGYVQLALGPGKTQLRALEYAACDGILQTLDPLSQVLRPARYAEMTPAADSAAVGVTLSIRDQAMTVMSAVPGSPAASAGLMRLDRLTRIDDESTSNMTLDDTIIRLRGKYGSRITLWIERDGALGWKNSKAFELIRRPVLLSSVSSRQLAPGIGYVRLENFQASTADELDQALTELSQNGPLKGLVLDLRDNMGGLLAQATAVADRFLDGGVIVTTVGASEGREQKLAQPARTRAAYPMVVLLNAVSASASEIVAGALQRLDRAVIVGERSAGAGTVQLAFPHLDPDGAALKLTISQFLLSGDIPVSGVGIAPDVALESVTIDPSDMHFLPSEHARIPSRAAKTGDTTFAEPSVMTVRYEPRLPERLARSASDNRDDARLESDFQVRLARDLVARMSVGDRAKALASVRDFIETTRTMEARSISEHLRRLGIDWAAPDRAEQAGPPTGDLRVSVTTDRARDTVPAGQPMTVTVRLTNKGARPIHRLRAVTRSENPYFDGHELLFGRVAPGKTVTASATLGRVPKDAPSRQDIVKVHFSAEGGEPPLDAELRPIVTGAARATPQLELGPVALASRAERVRIAGSARAPAGVLDVAIAIGRRKVDYLSNQRTLDSTKFDFEFDVALDPGINVITVSARDNKNVPTRRTVIVRRDGPGGESLTPAPSSLEAPLLKPRTRSYPQRNAL